MMYKILLVSLVTVLTACGGEYNTGDTRNREKALPSSEGTAVVYVSAKAVQCEFQGHPPDKTAEPLLTNSIPVLSSNCGEITGMMIAAMCGKGTTDIHLHKISRSHLPRAEKLGYRSARELIDEKKGTAYEVIACKKSQ